MNANEFNMSKKKEELQADIRVKDTEGIKTRGTFTRFTRRKRTNHISLTDQSKV